MFDTMTVTKVVGGACGALLIFLLGNWAAESIYYSAAHGDAHQQGYVIEVETADDAAGEAVEEGPSFAEVYASADAAEGEGEFRACKSCHALEAGKNGAGPSLYGVVGRTTGSEAGYSYSGALIAVVDTWTPEALDAFLKSPSGYAPGTKMSFRGIKKIEDRANLIAYLDGLDN